MSLYDMCLLLRLFVGRFRSWFRGDLSGRVLKGRTSLREWHRHIGRGRVARVTGGWDLGVLISLL